MNKGAFIEGAVDAMHKSLSCSWPLQLPGRSLHFDNIDLDCFNYSRHSHVAIFVTMPVTLERYTFYHHHPLMTSKTIIEWSPVLFLGPLDLYLAFTKCQFT